jgi:hypothetical protein
MVHDVVIRTGAGRVPHIIGTVFLGGGGDLLWRTGEPDDARVERFNVLPYYLRCISLRIDSDEERLNLCGILPKFLENRGDCEQRGRAATWTEGISEIDQQPFAVISPIGHCPAVWRREREGATDCHLHRASTRGWLARDNRYGEKNAQNDRQSRNAKLNQSAPEVHPASP